MSKLIRIKTHHDERGSLSVIEKNLPFEIKRVYFIYDVKTPDIIRGGHRHKKTVQAAVCLNGSCVIECIRNGKQTEYFLDTPEKCLILEPQDWHMMKNFSAGSVLAILASEYYDKDDYIYEKN
jgi:dTDP-4-dehydrorhamnose 3,5-epimerase-like enzyme